MEADNLFDEDRNHRESSEGVGQSNEMPVLGELIHHYQDSVKTLGFWQPLSTKSRVIFSQTCWHR